MKRFTQTEVRDLKKGMDFRQPRYRREVFLRFYEFHMKHKSHPGAVYYAFPYIFEKLKMDQEQKYWFCFINGVCQNVVTTYEIYTQFPDFKNLDLDSFSKFFRDNYAKFGWDTDRKWVKNKLEMVIKGYQKHIGSGTQEEFFNGICNTGDEFQNFEKAWDFVMSKFEYFGRLSTFSYLEYMRIAGLNIDCNSLFLEDMDGSKSHRNGLCKVLGRDDLDWHDKNLSFIGYDKDCIGWLVGEGEQLLKEAKERIKDKDVSYFTLESTLCCYKSWFRLNRRYPNVYNDMFHDRIKNHETKFGKSMDFFWKMRRDCLPKELRVEDNPNDLGLSTLKQNHFRKTGEVIMMDKEWDCFKNKYNDFVDSK